MAARCWNWLRRKILSSSARFRSSCSWRISSSNLFENSCCWILASKKLFAPTTPTSSTLISVSRANSLKPDPLSKSPALAFLYNERNTKKLVTVDDSFDLKNLISKAENQTKKINLCRSPNANKTETYL